MDSRLPALLASLGEAQSFGAAAHTLIESLLAAADAALAGSSFKGRICRGVLHSRRADGYRSVVVLDRDQAAQGPRAESDKLPSATAWRWVSERGRPVALDVYLGSAHVLGDASAEDIHTSAEGFDTNESQARMMERNATHILALPFCAPGGQLAGMVSVEADCRAATGTGFIWPAVVDELWTLTRAAAPFLTSLPHEVRELSGPLLPVVGASMVPVIETLRLFAMQEETLLLSGPTGSGKSRLARWCHERSVRRQAPIESVDLATIPEELQLAELFGWRKGAFTGAQRDTPGAVTRAQGGTLFIDEIDKLSLRAQAGVLRVLEERKYRPLGDGASEREADVRFIVGTGASLQAAVESGSFRADLYYRINVLPVRIPPLAERVDEVIPWANHMVGRRHARGGDPNVASASIDPAAEPLLIRQSWPGNLRQLDNIVRRAYALSLTEAVPATGAHVLRAHHLERALQLEDAGVQRSLFDLMRAAATAFVQQAERVQKRGGVLSLEQTASWQGFVIEAAIQHTGSIEGALALLGKQAMLDRRNHHKLLRQEQARIRQLAATIGEPAPPELGHEPPKES